MFVQLKQIAQSCSGLGLGVVWTPTDKTEPRPAAWVLPAWCYLNKLSGIAHHHVFWELLPWGFPRLLDNVLSCRSSCWVLGFTVEVGNHPHSEGTFFKSTAGPILFTQVSRKVSVTSLHLVLKDVAFKLIFPTARIVSRSMSEFVSTGLLSLPLVVGWLSFQMPSRRIPSWRLTPTCLCSQLPSYLKAFKLTNPTTSEPNSEY